MNNYKKSKLISIIIIFIILISFFYYNKNRNQEIQVYNITENYSNSTVDLKKIDHDFPFDFLFADAVQSPFSLNINIEEHPIKGIQSVWLYASQANNHGQLIIEHDNKTIGTVNNQLPIDSIGLQFKLTYVGDINITNNTITLKITGNNNNLVQHYSELGLIVITSKGISENKILNKLNLKAKNQENKQLFLIILLIVGLYILFDISIKNKILLSYYQTLFLLLLALSVILLSINGGIKYYSALPHWDSWNGNLDFIIKIINGDYSSFWVQHNEHRIAISRVLFIVDQFIFNGSNKFLIFCNYLLVTFTCYLFYITIKLLHINIKNKINLLLLTITMLFLWTQSENFTWAFQSQFFLAQILPLWAFITLGIYFTTGLNKWYYICMLLGILSVGTMANGILVLPLLLIAILIKEKKSFNSISTIIITILTFSIYYSGYVSVKQHGSLTDALLYNTQNFISYIFVYLGGIFYYLYSSPSKNINIAILFGIIFFILFCLVSLKILINKFQYPPIVFSLILFITYIIITAIGTSGGRSIFGLEQATTSRYTTPTIMAWISLIIVFDYLFSSKNIYFIKTKNILFIIFYISIINYQINAIKVNPQVQFEKKLTMLGLAMGVNDDKRVLKAFPDALYVYQLSENAIKMNLSFFGNYPFKGLKDQLNNKFLKKSKPHKTCKSSLKGIKIISTDNNFLEMHTWISYPTTVVPELIKAVNVNNDVIGFLLPQESKNFLFQDVKNKPLFKGFIKSNELNSTVYLIDDNSNCYAELFLKQP